MMYSKPTDIEDILDILGAFVGLSFVGLWMLAFLASGWGLWKRRSWGRTFALIIHWITYLAAIGLSAFTILEASIYFAGIILVFLPLALLSGCTLWSLHRGWVLRIMIPAVFLLGIGGTLAFEKLRDVRRAPVREKVAALNRRIEDECDVLITRKLKNLDRQSEIIQRYGPFRSFSSEERHRGWPEYKPLYTVVAHFEKADARVIVRREWGPHPQPEVKLTLKPDSAWLRDHGYEEQEIIYSQKHSTFSSKIWFVSSSGRKVESHIEVLVHYPWNSSEVLELRAIDENLSMDENL